MEDHGVSVRTIRYGDLNVSRPLLGHGCYRAARCGLLWRVGPENVSTLATDFVRHREQCPGLNGIRLEGLTDLNVLESVPDLHYLEVASEKPVSANGLKRLRNLRGLLLPRTSAPINFEWFPQLEEFNGSWHARGHRIGRAHQLRTLTLRSLGRASQGLLEFAGAPRLERIELIRPSITSLEGLERLEDLRVFSLVYASQLESLDAFTSSVRIRELSIENAKRIESYSFIGMLPMLRWLTLSRCAAIPDLRWMGNLSRLDHFSFVETDVVDGDLSPLLELPSLRYVGTLDRKHYSHRSDELCAMLCAQREDEFNSP